MKPASFVYERAESIDDALARLAERGDEVKVIAGGQSLVALMNMRFARPDSLLDITQIDELRGWRLAGGTLEIGALTTQTDLERDGELAKHCPLLAEAIPHIAHAAIRNRGTIGGTVAHADPAAELPIVLSALRGSVTLRKQGSERVVAADDLFYGFLMTAIAEDELLVTVNMPCTGTGTGTAFEEFARRPGDFALVSVACVVDHDGDQVGPARVVLGGVDSTPFALDGLQGLEGAGRSDAVERAAALVREQVDPTGDIHGSTEYRRNLASELTRRAFERALTR